MSEEVISMITMCSSGTVPWLFTRKKPRIKSSVQIFMCCEKLMGYVRTEQLACSIEEEIIYIRDTYTEIHDVTHCPFCGKKLSKTFIGNDFFIDWNWG